MKKKSTAIDVLKRMRTLLRKGWTQHWFAKNAKGSFRWEGDADVVSFCLVGAMNRACRDLGATKQGVALLLRKSLPTRKHGLTEFNDAKGRKKSEVIAVVIRAIEKAEKSLT